MADGNDDEWLYGENSKNEEVDAQEKEEEKQPEVEEEQVTTKNGNAEMSYDEVNFEEAGDHEHLIADESKNDNEESNDQGDEDTDDDDDDDINVVIGDILPKNAGPSVRFDKDGKAKQPGSKFNIEEFESVGTINGQPSIEFAIESIEDKPWRKPGADITDYFNYGFNEETWRAYCERQKRIRIHESGVGLASLTAAQNPQGTAGAPNDSGMQMMPQQRHGINIGFKGRMPHPRPPKPGTIDVIGAPSHNPIRAPTPRENVIQVMTADRREYSRTVVNQPMQFNMPPEEFYNHEEQDAFNYGYEPTQDSQWNQNQGGPGWAPSDIKELTPMNQPPPNMPGINMNIPPPHGPSHSMPLMNPQMIPPLMGHNSMQSSMNINMKQEQDDKREGRSGRMSNYNNRDMRDDRKRRERSSSRDRDRSSRSTRDDRYRGSDRGSTRDSGRDSGSGRRRSKSRERTSKRSRSRDKTRRSKSRDKDRSRRDDKSKRSSAKKDEI